MTHPHDHDGPDPTLTGLLTAEIREPEEDADGGGPPADDFDGLVALLAVAGPPPATDPVAEELDWFFGEDALLPVSARRRLLAASVDALLQRRLAVDGAPEGWADDWAAELAAAPGEAGGIGGLLARLGDGTSSVAAVHEDFVGLITRSGVDPFLAYAAASDAARRGTAGGRRPARRSLRGRAVPMMAGAAPDDAAADLAALREALVRLTRRWDAGHDHA